MGRNSNSRKRTQVRQPSSGGSAPAARPERPNVRREIVERAAQTDAKDAATAEGVDTTAVLREATPEPREITDEQLRGALASLEHARSTYAQCAESAKERRSQAAAAEQAAMVEAGKLRQAREDLEGARTNVIAQAARIREWDDDVTARETAVEKRELEADAGFPALRAERMGMLDAELAAQREHAATDLRRAREAQAATLAVQREALDAEREAFNALVARQTTDLDERRKSLAEEQTRLADDLAEVRRERLAVERREQHVGQEVQALAASTIQELNAELLIAQAKAKATADTVTQLSTEVTEIRAQWTATGGRDPRLILSMLSKVQEENRELQNKLAVRLDDDTLDRLRFLENQNRDLNAERERLTYELHEERGRQLADRISNLQVQQLADAQEQFDVVKRGYEYRISELKGTLDKLVDGGADPTRPLFPNCLALDDSAEFQEPGHLIDEVPNLHQLARSLQGAMWRNRKRAYRLDDICGVLGGLAMSRLHLLEGPSGIGKTSLPLALAEALGTGCSIIEVQAGWRDRYDLFGHYNSFEHRFQEEPFLLALYKARTPRFRNRPFFIVLDEMNLARPEQYFSVLLSKLETGSDDPIQLAPVASGRKPVHMDDSGTSISLPRNVWFIGTANQDESTLEFADKTYNRSYVLELPAHPPYVPGRGQVQPYSFAALEDAFDQAGQEHRPAVNAVLNVLNRLRAELHEVARIHVDPRIEKQLKRYVPVVVAARGDDIVLETSPRDNAPSPSGKFDPVAFAADQFIASKVLHQLHNRFEVIAEDVSHLEEAIELAWMDAFPGSEPSECQRVLGDQRRRRKG